jgi:TRAP-type mannitol/chloroaromatic compound transport system substrate-binding protein
MPRAIPLVLLLVLCASCKDETPAQGGGNAPAAAPVRLKVASAFNQTLPVLGTNIVYTADRLAKASDGAVTMKIYDPGKLVPVFEILDAVSTGKIDAGYAAAGYWRGKLPAAPLFSSVPFGPEAGEYMAWLYEGNGMTLYQKMYDNAQFNVKVLVCAVVPPETSGWFAKPINSAEDLKGLKIRFFGLGAAVLERLGAATTLLPSGEIFQNLEKGVIDATEFSMPVVDEKLGFHKIVNYNYFPGWHQQTTFLELLINGDVWNEMSTSQQTLLEMACRDSMINSLAVGEAAQAEVMQENVASRGVKNMYWSREMLELFEKTWYEVAAEESGNNAFFKLVWDDMKAFRDQYDLWESHAFLQRAAPE